MQSMEMSIEYYDVGPFFSTEDVLLHSGSFAWPCFDRQSRGFQVI